MPLYLCVDCGGSKTSAVICDGDGQIIGRAYGGSSNLAYVGFEAFMNAIRISVGDALKTCVSPPSVEPVSLPPSNLTFAAAWLGVSGVDSPAAVASILQPLSDLLGIPMGPKLAVANDTHLLASPVQRYPDVTSAVAVVGGTGATAASFRKAVGQLEEVGRIGGWGWILGDEGGGFSVGREAIRYILARNDRDSVKRRGSLPLAKEGSLEDRILRYFSCNTIMELLNEVHAADPGSISSSAPTTQLTAPHLSLTREKRLSSLSPLVFSAAFENNDTEALAVLQLCAGMLADQIAVLVGERTEEQPGLVSANESVLSFGGSLVGLKVYRKMVLDALTEKGHVFRRVEFVDDAAASGALALAVRYKSNA
ncbi:hypothetical protein E1B28_010087 [Marasmius oreades]|uniref:N-acetyl-D-glucosamine kinase n=1 Tax=Marasmius oreades TaxID=181124 RepID=A0A9P7RXK5_9AGAR|nr:uncharacterized protein E1B28_010087 [Marasmius oreades]KAG7091026.1 hypothetical protein E1B28_010087 [Marasmius oreades]